MGRSDPRRRAIDLPEWEQVATTSFRGCSEGRASVQKTGALAARRVTLAIPRFRVTPTGQVPRDFRNALLTSTLVMIDGSDARPSAQQSLGATLTTIEAGLYVVVDADGPFSAGDVPDLIREVQSGLAVVVRSVIWRVFPRVGSDLLRPRSRLALWLADRMLRYPQDVLSGLFVIERPRQAAESGS